MDTDYWLAAFLQQGVDPEMDTHTVVTSANR
jgi:hypothetical protein